MTGLSAVASGGPVLLPSVCLSSRDAVRVIPSGPVILLHARWQKRYCEIIESNRSPSFKCYFCKHRSMVTEVVFNEDFNCHEYYTFCAHCRKRNWLTDFCEPYRERLTIKTDGGYIQLPLFSQVVS